MRKNDKRWILLPVLILLSAISAKAQQANDSVDTYQNHTVSTIVSIQGRDTLTVSDVIVTSTGHLKLTAPAATVVTNNLNVQLGGTLEINGGRQYFIKFTYDAAGNRIRREKESN